MGPVLTSLLLLHNALALLYHHAILPFNLHLDLIVATKVVVGPLR